MTPPHTHTGSSCCTRLFSGLLRSQAAPSIALVLAGTLGGSALAAGAASETRSLPADLTAPALSLDSAALLNQTLTNLDALTRQYMEHVIVLSSGFFEGRLPGTRSDILTADYGAWHFQRLGLTPAFDATETAADGSVVLTPNGSWFQPFEVGGTPHLVTASAAWSINRAVESLTIGEAFSPLGFSGNGTASGPLVFVGYGIEDGRDGYSSFDDNTDLTGKIAIVFRFEPMDARGRSLWGNRGRWSNYASLGSKMQALAKRGAAGIIMLQPPGADDPRSQQLESISTTNLGFTLDIPAIMLDMKAGAALIEAASSNSQSLMDLRRKADEGAITTLDLNAQPVQFSMTVELETIGTMTNNVGAILKGKGALANEFVVIGGHKDHLGYGESSSRYRGEQRLIHAGADDNASGTAGVLLAAEVLAKQYAKLPEDAQARSVLFLLFGAEEMGLLGARHFVNNTTLNAGNTTAMLNMDMIGRLGQNDLTISGTGTAREWDAVLDPVIERMGFTTNKAASGVGASDHTWFFRSDIPVLHFFSGLHSDYHHPNDTWEKIHYAEATRLVVGVAEITYGLATTNNQLSFEAGSSSPARRGPRPQAALAEGERDPSAASAEEPPQRPQLSQMRVRMGVMPGSYEEGGVGLEVAGVTPGGSADTAGIKAGDVILLWNGEELAGVVGLMSRLSSAEPGEVVDLVVQRGKERINLQMTLQARDATDG